MSRPNVVNINVTEAVNGFQVTFIDSSGIYRENCETEAEVFAIIRRYGAREEIRAEQGLRVAM